jgi:uncharacterized membrane protein YuzA (DUF378 family)
MKIAFLVLTILGALAYGGTIGFSLRRGVLGAPEAVGLTVLSYILLGGAFFQRRRAKKAQAASRGKDNYPSANDAA